MKMICVTFHLKAQSGDEYRFSSSLNKIIEWKGKSMLYSAMRAMMKRRIRPCEQLEDITSS